MNKNDLIDKLLGLMTEDLEEAPKIQPTRFARFEIRSGSCICCTGTLKNYTREEFIETCEAAGLYVDSTVKKKTKYLVVGEKTASAQKVGKAQAQDTIILNEDEFMYLIAELHALD